MIVRWKDVDEAVQKSRPELIRHIAQYRDGNSGAFPRLMKLMRLLDKRLERLGANTADLDAVIKAKSGIFTKSKTLVELKEIRTSVGSLSADAKFMLKDAPHAMDSIWIN